ncbi:BTAD domain-containing putative transcriptional regulator [Longimicrobium sp.]|uniref:BTAD domain-containing putative transcriptional regulator n=1 Tax=Longimicrobium sp. TaxID=2029185 RepID=UPI002EDA6761
MYRLRTLGTLDLVDPGGAPVTSLLAQPKRAALLAYLALARPHGPVRRDILLATFWPEMPDDRARAALRNALSFLRKAAPGVLAVRTDDTVELAVDQTVCDARQMQAALAAGDVLGALGHYGGDLLAGLHVDDAPSWEQWLDAERLRLRHMALAAARGAAEAARGRGEMEPAVALARRACEIDPEDEPSVRRLMELLADSGDPGGALREYDRFAARLMRDLEVEPGPATEALRRALRVRAEPAAAVPPPAWIPEPAPEPVAAPSPESAVLSREPTDGAAPPPPAGSPDDAILAPAADVAVGLAPAAGPSWIRPRRRRRWLAAVASVAAVLALWLLRPGGAGPLDAATVGSRVAVLPFAARTGPANAYLGEGMADLLSSRLDGTGELTTVDPFALLSFLRTWGDDATGLDAGRAAAERFGAGRFVLGSVVEAGGRLHLSAALYAPDGRRLVRAEVPELREDSLFAGVDALVRSLVAQEMDTPPERMDRTAALTTTSLPALKAYLGGNRAFRDGDFARAAEWFTQAVRGDSTFAVAWYRLSVSQDWAAADGSAAAARALRMADRLPPAEQRLLRARVAFRTGSATVAEGLLRELTATRPDNIEAWNELAEVLHHRAMWQGRSIEGARGAWMQVLALDPRNVSARVHLAHVASLQGRAAEASSLVRAIAELSPRHEALTRVRTMAAFGEGDLRAQDDALAALRAQRPRDTNDLPPWGAAWRTADFLTDPGAGLRIAGLMVEPGRDRQSRLVGFTTLAHMQMARGRWRDARAQADSAARIDAGYGARTWAFLAAFSPAALPRDETLRAYRQLAATAVPSAQGTGGVVDEERGRYPAARHQYLLGVLAVRLGDTVEAHRRAASLAALEDTSRAGRFAYHLRHQLHARLRAAAGDVPGALVLVQRGWPPPVPWLFVKDDSYSTVAERYFRAQLLARAGRESEALAWYGSLTEDISRGIMFPVAAQMEQARVLGRLGRRREAAEHTARFRHDWRDADPDALAQLLQPAREAAPAEARAVNHPVLPQRTRPTGK